MIYARGFQEKRAHKHGAERVTVDGQKFDSKREARRYAELQVQEKGGVISGLQRQVPFILCVPVVLDGRKKPALKYIADFVYLTQDGRRVVEDCKAPHLRQNTAYRIKRHLMKAYYNVEVMET